MKFPLPTSLGTSLLVPLVANVLQVESSFWERVKREKEGLEQLGSDNEAYLKGKVEWLAGLCLARRETSEERTSINLQNPQTYTWKGKSGNPSRHHQRCQDKSHSSHQYIHLSPVQMNRSQLCRSGRATDPTQQKRQCWGWRWTEALASGPASAINKFLGPPEPLSGLSFSSDSFTRIIWRLKYGVKLNGCRDERMRVVMFLCSLVFAIVFCQAKNP